MESDLEDDGVVPFGSDYARLSRFATHWPVSSSKNRMDDTAALSITDYASYEDYLDHHILHEDRKYLESEELMRQLVELGYRGSGDVLKREEFEARKREAEELSHKVALKAPRSLASANIEGLSNYPFLKALADREEAVRNGKLTCILFIRDRNSKNQEISGYIDFTHRLKTEDFVSYFARKRRLLPRPSDLSYYNWDTQTCTSNPTPNFEVIADNASGLLFKNKRDRKIINVDPSADSGDNTSRHEIKTKEYVQVVIYDHLTRRKN